MRVLVVEDEAPLLDQLSGRLRDEGYAVDTASDGQAGLYIATPSTRRGAAPRTMHLAWTPISRAPLRPFLSSASDGVTAIIGACPPAPP